MMSLRKDAVCLALLWLSGMALRLTILAVPPLILPIRDALDLSSTGVGILTGLPVAMFALAAVPGSVLIARLGSRRTLLCGLLLVTAGGALRGGSWDAITLYAATGAMGGGVAIMQPSMPVLVRDWLPARVGFATAVYSNGLLVGEILPVWLTPLLLPAFGDSWRLSLSIWSVPVLLTALAAATLSPRANPTSDTASNPWPNWRDPFIWRLGLLLGANNAVYFASNAFLPPFLDSEGHGNLIQYALTALNFGQLPASLLLLVIAKTLERKAWPYIFAGLLMAASAIGLVLMPGPWSIFWAGLTGFGAGFSLISTLTLPPLLAGPGDVGRVSAAMFTISYAFAGGISFLCGVASDLTGTPASAFVLIGACGVSLVLSALGLRARRRLL